MTDLHFAIAIILPSAEVGDIVKATTYNGVHIIDKETYDTGKDYALFMSGYEPYTNGSRIKLLFVFPDGQSILATDDVQIAQAVEKCRDYDKSKDYNEELI
jgi:hypothetical protein